MLRTTIGALLQVFKVQPLGPTPVLGVRAGASSPKLIHRHHLTPSGTGSNARKQRQHDDVRRVRRAVVSAEPLGPLRRKTSGSSVRRPEDKKMEVKEAHLRRGFALVVARPQKATGNGHLDFTRGSR